MKGKANKTEQFHMRMSAKLLEALSRRSDESGRPQSRIVEDALILYMQRSEIERMQECAVLRKKEPLASC